MNPSTSFHLPSLQPNLRPDLAKAIESMPSSRHIGLRVVGFAPGGVSVIEVPIAPAITFDGKAVQGGITGMLADYAGVSAASSTLSPEWASSTTGFEVHHVAPAVGDKLVAIGQAMSVGKRNALSTVRVWALKGEEATLVAVGTTTSLVFERRG